MAKVLYEYINQYWRDVPYRNQMDIDRKQWPNDASGNGSCVSHAIGSAAYALFGERADVPWVLTWASYKYGIIPCQQLDFAIEFAMTDGLLLESEAPDPQVNMMRMQGVYGSTAAKHKITEHIDFGNTAYGFDPVALKKALRDGYVLLATAGSALWGRFHPDRLTLRWDTSDIGASHVVCIGGYQERDDGDYFIVQNSQPNCSGSPQGIVYAPMQKDGWFRFHAVRTKRLENGGNTVATYSLKKDGSTKLSTNFQVKEFRCKDGGDKILIDSALVTILQKIRDHYGKAVNITSAYRTASYNSKIGGAAKSQHLYGTAADIRITGVTPRDLARYIETEVNPGGLGLYDYGDNDKAGFVHVDTRAGKSRWVQTKSNGSATTVNSIVADYLDKGKGRSVVKLGSAGADVLELERLLTAAGYAPMRAKADTALIAALELFQWDKGLKVDGECGAKSWAALGVK